MRSRTAKPFHTTNLVVFAPESVKNKCEDYNFVAHGDALIVDPGCRANFHKEVCQFVTLWATFCSKIIIEVTLCEIGHAMCLNAIFTQCRLHFLDTLATTAIVFRMTSSYWKQVVRWKQLFVLDHTLEIYKILPRANYLCAWFILLQRRNISCYTIKHTNCSFS
jgi:hypothetical protein